MIRLLDLAPVPLQPNFQESGAESLRDAIANCTEAKDGLAAFPEFFDDQ